MAVLKIRTEVFLKNPKISLEPKKTQIGKAIIRKKNKVGSTSNYITKL